MKHTRHVVAALQATFTERFRRLNRARPSTAGARPGADRVHLQRESAVQATRQDRLIEQVRLKADPTTVTV